MLHRAIRVQSSYTEAVARAGARGLYLLEAKGPCAGAALPLAIRPLGPTYSSSGPFTMTSVTCANRPTHGGKRFDTGNWARAGQAPPNEVPLAHHTVGCITRND
jgi:hypothetical protein